VAVSLDNILWFATDVAAAIVIGLLIYHRLWRAFPIFFLYNVRTVVGDAGAAIILHSYHSFYLSWYLVETIADSILLFGVLVELTWSILRPVRASLSRRALIPVIGVILVLGIVVWPFAALPGLVGSAGEWHLLVQLEQTVSILQVIFLLVLIASSQLLSIGWRDRELQVATGLGFFAFVSIAAALLHSHETSRAQYQHLFRLQIAAYICTLFYWIVSFARKEAARREFTPQMQHFLLAAAGAAKAARISLTESQVRTSRKHDRR
jgi:hypothetical protein